MEEYYDEVKEYFSTEVWANMSEKNKQKFANYFYMYRVCVELGVDVVVPDFMNKSKEFHCCQYCMMFYTLKHLKDMHEDICVERTKKHVNIFAQKLKGTFNKLLDTSKLKQKPKLKPIKKTTRKAPETKRNMHRLKRSSALPKKKAEKPQIYPKMHCCRFCNFDSPSALTLLAHINNHFEKMKPKNKLNASLQNKAKIKPYLYCDICDYKTRFRNLLKEHFYKHTNQTPFKCSLCDFCSVRSGTVKRHFATHLTDKPFKCSECDYQCGQKTELTFHIYKHYGLKPFKCSLCEYSCMRKKALMNHMLRHEQKH